MRVKTISRMTSTFLMGMLIFIAGCNRPTAIKEISSHPENYKDKEVNIQGRVVSNFALPAMPKVIYLVSDGSGQMAVSSPNGAPATNSEVTVKGKLQNVPMVALPVVGKFKIAEVMIEETERTVSEQK